MSSFVVQDTTINHILDGLQHASREYFGLVPALKELGFDDSCDGYSALGAAMHQLNLDAVASHYPEDAALIPSYQHHYAPTSAVQAYKNLSCWIYQCTEGTIPDSALYQFFTTKVRTALADRIIRDLPLYDKAKWD